ncbi:hypothetical protein HN385_03045 [archaeon]|jgi:plastocyanin|nr:hypothetical protein [archaeon]MBT3450835.1 hypothetical protein [archaeon]MBT6868456.1 hypothetical protein [archaeon]MBT7193555.1 hypothetical protein [archaeon]MBT7381250.1 hypothetical protein [archaeon]
MLKKSMFYLVLFSMFILSASLVVAEVDLSNIDLSSLEGATIPDFLEPLFGNENINIHVTLGSGKVLTMGVSISDATVQEIKTEALDDASLDVYVSEGVMEKLSQSTDPLSVLKNALDNDEIVYKANGLWNKFKFGVAGFFMKFASDDSGESNDIAIVDEILEEVEEAEEDTEDVVVEEEETENEEEVETESETEDEDVVTEEETESDDTTEETETEEANEVEVEEETEEETEEESSVTLIEIETTEFNPSELTINVGDTVQWINTRDDNTIKTAMILGNRECNYIRSSILQYGETFQWTFTEPMSCVITDAIITTAVLTITVEP